MGHRAGGSTLPPKNALHTSDAHAINDVSGQSEGDSLGGGEGLPLLKGHTCEREDDVRMVDVDVSMLGWLLMR